MWKSPANAGFSFGRGFCTHGGSQGAVGCRQRLGWFARRVKPLLGGLTVVDHEDVLMPLARPGDEKQIIFDRGVQHGSLLCDALGLCDEPTARIHADERYVAGAPRKHVGGVARPP